MHLAAAALGLGFLIVLVLKETAPCKVGAEGAVGLPVRA
jgi:hypothetical protein